MPAPKLTGKFPLCTGLQLMIAEVAPLHTLTTMSATARVFRDTKSLRTGIVHKWALHLSSMPPYPNGEPGGWTSAFDILLARLQNRQHLPPHRDIVRLVQYLVLEKGATASEKDLIHMAALVRLEEYQTWLTQHINMTRDDIVEGAFACCLWGDVDVFMWWYHEALAENGGTGFNRREWMVMFVEACAGTHYQIVDVISEASEGAIAHNAILNQIDNNADRMTYIPFTVRHNKLHKILTRMAYDSDYEREDELTPRDNLPMHYDSQPFLRDWEARQASNRELVAAAYAAEIDSDSEEEEVEEEEVGEDAGVVAFDGDDEDPFSSHDEEEEERWFNEVLAETIRLTQEEAEGVQTSQDVSRNVPGSDGEVSD